MLPRYVSTGIDSGPLLARLHLRGEFFGNDQVTPATMDGHRTKKSISIDLGAGLETEY